MVAAGKTKLLSIRSLMALLADPTHQYLRVHLIEGCRQVGNHAGKGDVVTSISTVTENIGEDSYELGHATRQFF